uniref:C2H2-type domain-containing protein n=1 Tax=Brugia malayi TaxID=6279 RepID=A8PU22_BRUMA
MFFTVSITPIIWFNLLLCIASDKNETFYPPNFSAADEIITNNTYSGVSDSFDYNNFEPLFSSEFLFDPSQFIDFAQVSGIEDISSKESNSETDLFTITPHPDAQSGTSSPLNVDTDDIITYMHLPGSQQNVVPIYFHQLTLSSDGTSGQHGNAELINMDNKHFSDSLNVADYRGSTNEGSKTDNRKYICYYPGCTVIATNYNEYITHRENTWFNLSSMNAECPVVGGHSTMNHHFAVTRKRMNLILNANKRSYECLYPGCAVIAMNYNEYVTHKKTHGQPLIYECRVPGCGRTFNHRTSFRSHKETHEPNPQCEGCGRFFTSRNTLTRHKESCQAISHKRSYECLYPGCAVIAKSYKEYITHRKTHGQPFIYECRVPGCGRTFDYDSTFFNHKQTHEPHPQCEGCGRFFTTRNALKSHKKNCQTKSRQFANLAQF